MRIKLFVIFFISLSCGCTEKYKGKLLLIPEDSSSNFQFPYYLFIPEETPRDSLLNLIIEPNNTGFVSDEFENHREKAERTASLDYYVGNYLAVNLDLPLLVPVFPRPESDWKIYTHSLDRDAMLQKDNSLERLDLQLMAMANDAKQRLNEMGYLLKVKYILTGFSASGTFVNRFSLLHPEKVEAVAAGGLNGLLMLPIDSMRNTALEYPVGIADFEKLTAKPFKAEEFKILPQFLYMGELDDNDAIPYNDGYDEEERIIIYELLGEKMMPDRWEKCKDIYQNERINATIKTYRGLGHEHPEEVKDEILEFVKNEIRK